MDGGSSQPSAAPSETRRPSRSCIPVTVAGARKVDGAASMTSTGTAMGWSSLSVSRAGGGAAGGDSRCQGPPPEQEHPEHHGRDDDKGRRGALARGGPQDHADGHGGQPHRYAVAHAAGDGAPRGEADEPASRDTGKERPGRGEHAHEGRGLVMAPAAQGGEDDDQDGIDEQDHSGGHALTLAKAGGP